MRTKTGSIFEVDKQGLAKLLERRGKQFAVLELWQNAADEDGVTRIDITLERTPGTAVTHLTVEDDAPEGFADMAHAYTLFAESAKKGRADQRGRFNLGEKLVIAICDVVAITTTKGRIEFTELGRAHYDGEADRRPHGSIFYGELRMTAEEYDHSIRALHSLIVPEGIETWLNGSLITPRKPLKSFTVSLRTEIADDEGYLRPTRRKTTVGVYEVAAGETAMLYEMGIPVVETDDTWHIDVGQKVPLTTDRDNVPPGWLRDVRAAVLNECAALLTPEAATAKWIDDALEDETVEPEAVKTVVKDRFGEKAVIDDKTDAEGTKIAVSKGYTVIPGGAFSKPAWKNVKKSEAVLPAGQVTPSPNPNEGNEAIKLMEPEHWPQGVKLVAEYAEHLARELLGVEIHVRIATAFTWKYAATYGPVRGYEVARQRDFEGQLTLNYARLGHDWFNDGRCERVDALLIHEFAHHKVRDHLAEEFHEECCHLGAKMVQLAIEQPDLPVGFEAGAEVAVP